MYQYHGHEITNMKTVDSLSLLQHIRHSQDSSPLRAINTVRFLKSARGQPLVLDSQALDTYVMLLASVQHEPMNVFFASLLSLILAGVLWNCRLCSIVSNVPVLNNSDHLIVGKPWATISNVLSAAGRFFYLLVNGTRKDKVRYTCDMCYCLRERDSGSAKSLEIECTNVDQRIKRD